MTTARMKGNKGPNGERQPPLPFDLRPGRNGAEWGNPLEASAAPSVPRPRARSRWKAAMAPVVAFGGIAAIVAAAIIGYAASKDTATTTPPGGADSHAALIPTATPDARATEGAAVAIAVASSSTTTATVGPATATATSSPTPTLVPPTATSTPSGLIRARYVVAPGDSCESIRGKFNVPFSKADDFYTALGRLTGKTTAAQCSFFPGDVVCVPSLADLGQPAVLARDVACLTTIP